jgi:hypothetical protein
LLDYMMTNHGKEWCSWEPETLWQVTEIEKHKQPIFNKNKLQAIQVVMCNDLFWKEWDVFENITLAFNNIPPRFDIIEEVSPAQMAYAVRLAGNIRRYPGANTPGKDPIFSNEVKTYIATRAYLDGTVYLAEPLDFAQTTLNDLTGMSRLAKAVQEKSNDPDFEISEDPVSVGAAKVLIVKAYAFSNNRKVKV